MQSRIQEFPDGPKSARHVAFELLSQRENAPLGNWRRELPGLVLTLLDREANAGLRERVCSMGPPDRLVQVIVAEAVGCAISRRLSLPARRRGPEELIEGIRELFNPRLMRTLTGTELKLRDWQVDVAENLDLTVQTRDFQGARAVRVPAQEILARADRLMAAFPGTFVQHATFSAAQRLHQASTGLGVPSGARPTAAASVGGPSAPTSIGSVQAAHPSAPRPPSTGSQHSSDGGW